MEICNPLRDKIGRNTLHCQSEQIFYLCCKDCESYTACETYNNWIWNKFNDGSQFKESHNNQNNSRNYCGYYKPLNTEILYNPVDNYNKGSGWSSDLDVGTAHKGDNESSDYCCYYTLFRTYSRCYTKRNSKWKGNNSYNYTGHKVGKKFLLSVDRKRVV